MVSCENALSSSSVRQQGNQTPELCMSSGVDVPVHAFCSKSLPLLLLVRATTMFVS